MSKQSRTSQRINVPAIRARKGKEKIVSLTAYTYPFAQIIDPHTDIMLVGDSLGMVLYGMESTLPVTLDMMIAHGQAVSRAAQHALVVVDMPFASCQQSREQAFANAARVMAETGCDAVKIEGGEVMADTIRFLVERGVPVMGHVGLMPQHVHAYGGFRCQGKGDKAWQQVLADAKAVESAGAFSVVLEGVVEGLAAEVTSQLAIPVIGIGASVKCDGQVLVTEDMAGMFRDFTPKFVQKFGNMADELERAVSAYAAAVRDESFPSERHCFNVQGSNESSLSKIENSESTQS